MSDSLPEGYGQGESGPADSSESQVIPESTTTDTESAGTGHNPSWNEAFEFLPNEFHEKLKPVFGKWDSAANSRYEKVQQETAPYKVLIENQVPIDDIRQAFELRAQLANSPQEMFNRLAQHLGYDISELGNEDQESQGLNGYPDDEENPALAEMRKQQEGIVQYLALQNQREQEFQAQQQQAAQEKEWYDTTVSELDSLTTKYGEFDRNRAVQFAVWEAEKSGKAVDLEEGVKSMLEFRNSAIQQSANAGAPNVFSGNGNLASGRVDTSKMSDTEFAKFAMAKLKAKNGG